ncbi:MAG: hypothetical protein EBR82_37890 [Caulobacteraceae bacterium]|nr:hypothetical protein [Caulobacteraceae bacterium]
MTGGLSPWQRAALRRLSLGPAVASAKHPQFAALERRCMARGEIVEDSAGAWKYWTITHAGRQALQAGQ